MTGRLGIDFGTSNTVLAVWDEARQEGHPIHLEDYGQWSQFGPERVSTVPSLIHYGADRRIWIGDQVIQRGLKDSPNTLRWMKRYINHRTPICIHAGGRDITPAMAGGNFLTNLLVYAAQELDLQDEEIAFSVPVEAYEHYENWLSSIAENAGFPRVRFIDEPSAAAIGYGARIQPGNVYLIFDFGGGTLHASIIRMESQKDALRGQRCRVLGKSGKDIGGSAIDQWLFEEVLKANHCSDADDHVRAVSRALLSACEQAKMALSTQDSADIEVPAADGSPFIKHTFTRASLEATLDDHELFSDIHHAIQSALNQAVERGYTIDSIVSVLMVGGSSQIPSIQRFLRQQFGKERVFFERPLDAVARGAAAYAAGVDFFDHIQHEYAIRYVDPQAGAYAYKTLVNKGTPYPTREPVASLTVKASFNGQRQLGLAIFEIGDRRALPTRSIELVFDQQGAARIVPVTVSDRDQRTHFWMNEGHPTFLVADPPASQGDARFEVEFHIDANKRLLVTSRDLLTRKLIHENVPVVKLV